MTEPNRNHDRPATATETMTAMARTVAARFALIRLVLLVCAVGAAAAVGLAAGVDKAHSLFEAVADSRWGPVAFVVVYALAVVVMVPGTVGTVAAGALFGFRLGFVVAFSGAGLGAVAAFLVARLVGRDGVRLLLGAATAPNRRTMHWLPTIERRLHGNGLIAMIGLRLLPVVPFNGLNYAAGVVPIRFSRYAVATLVGIAPGVAFVTFATDRLMT